MESDKKEKSQNPRSNANILEKCTYGRMINLFKTGKNRDLQENDLYTTLNDYKSSSLGNELEKTWNLEKNIAQNSNRKPSLLRVLIQMFGAKYMLYGFIFSIDDLILRVCQPLLIGRLLAYYHPNVSNKNDFRYAYIYACGLVLNLFISRALCNTTIIKVSLCGMKMRIACCSTIYRKALRLSHTALGETTIGQMTNFLSNDVNRFDTSISHLHYLWIGPMQTIVVTYFLWLEIGVSSLFGIATFLFFIPLQVWFGESISKLRSKTAYKTDERVRLMNEIISGIQVIKMYTWEKPFKNIIEYARKKEIQNVKESLYIKAISSSVNIIQTRFQLFISILLYVFLGNYISIQKIYVVTSFYNLLLRSMTQFFRRSMEQKAELLVSIKRIQNFLLHEEKENINFSNLTSDQTQLMNNDDYELNMLRNNLKENDTEQLNAFDIFVSNATAKWTNNQTVNTLENINLFIKSGQLVAIIGPVGSGKSSLLQVILKELSLTKGRISVRGVISYASQEPWLFTGSIQQNILFASPMDEKRYKKVVKICALKNDFERFPHGDRTIVGDRGVTLSGGQKARINLARAIYKNADIYLLDDPLSAVDTSVGKHLFENCIRGYLKEKTCILITHQTQYLKTVDQIILMENASILYNGSYQELQRSGFDFTKLCESLTLTTIDSDTENSNKRKNNIDTYHDKSSQSSTESISSSIIDEEIIKCLEKPIQEAEICSSGQVSKSAYLSYFTNGGNICKIFFLFLIFIFTQLLITGGDYWISFWINEEEFFFRIEKNTFSNVNDSKTIQHLSDTFQTSSNIRQTCIIVYVVLIITMIATVFIRSIAFVSMCMRASINLHNKMFNAIIRAPMFFFDTNSSGRILNRFSKDIGTIDEILPFNLLDCVLIIILFMENVFVVGLVNIYLIIPSFVVGIIFYYLGVLCLPTCRNFKRLEGVTRSPIFSHMNACIQGLSTIRAYKAEKILSDEFDKYQDLHSSAWYMLVFSKTVYGVLLDIVCLVYIAIVILSFVAIRNKTYRGNIGLAITQTIQLAGTIQFGIRYLAELENQMVSVERVHEFSNIVKEAKLRSSPDKKPSKEWPNKGQIIFKNFNLRYNSNSKYILKNFNIRIESMEKVGIVGRTGAGKSSILTALLRLAHNEGSIIIDDIEVHELGLHDLRSKFSIIPQAPILFSGTMRKNLDPFDEYPDHVLWNALENVELKDVIENLPGGLNTKISEYGVNFSVGQKQLICLARAVVRGNKILILDEATANIDLQTDALIQNTIRHKFQNCTVLTIAHRLNTIINSDKILVIDAGTVVEFDHPFNLLKNKNSFFYKMVKKTGQETADVLYTTAAKNFF